MSSKFLLLTVITSSLIVASCDDDEPEVTRQELDDAYLKLAATCRGAEILREAL